MNLTVIYYTSNFISKWFAENTKSQLKKAIGDLALISVSQKPMDFGENICVGDIGRNAVNIYRQILIGIKAAKTKYVAMAEDDILYSAEHFNNLPKKTSFSYNIHKRSIFTWSDPPMFSYIKGLVINSLIAERKALIEAIEERFVKWKELRGKSLRKESVFSEPGRVYERQFGLKANKAEIFHTEVPNIVFSHEDAVGYNYLGIKKKMGLPRLKELPYWGKASDIVQLFRRR